MKIRFCKGRYNFEGCLLPTIRFTLNNYTYDYITLDWLVFYIGITIERNIEYD